MSMIKYKLHQIINYNQQENVQYILADYLLDNLNETNYLSINKVVKETLVSKTSIIKFCHLLGYDSWKRFYSDLQEDYLNEQLRINSLKMNAKLMFNNNDIDEYLKLNQKYYQEVQETIGFDDIQVFSQALKQAEDVFIIGETRELSLFNEVQNILAMDGKKVYFPKFLNSDEFNNQINNINDNTLVVITNGINSFEAFKEREMLASQYQLNTILASNCKIIFIGQKSSIVNENIKIISLPFSFNEYFIELAIRDFVYKTISYYLYK